MERHFHKQSPRQESGSPKARSLLPRLDVERVWAPPGTLSLRTASRPSKQLGQNLPGLGKLVRGGYGRPEETCQGRCHTPSGWRPLRGLGNQGRTWVGLKPQGKTCGPAAINTVSH